MHYMRKETAERPHFVGYKNIPEGFFTKNVLNTEYGLKPINDKEPDATAKVYMYSKWQEIKLYHIDNCIEIKRRKVIEHELTPHNIAQALYLVNKSAKVSRDTKQLNYEEKRHNIVQAAKTRQLKLYDLKQSVIDKLIKTNIIDIVGYHVMPDGKYTLLQLEGFKFHTPAKNIAGLIELGTIDEEISAEKTKGLTINFFEAVSILERFLND